MSRIKWPSVIIRQWCEDNLGIPKESHGHNGLHWTYDEFLTSDSKRKLYINVDEESDRVGMWNGWKSGEEGDFIDLVAKFNETSRKNAMMHIQKEYAKHLDPTKIIKENNYKKAKKNEKETVIDLPDKLYPVSYSDKYSALYINYLQSRFMSKKFIENCFYSYARKFTYMTRDNQNNLKQEVLELPFQDFVIIPYRDKFGKITYWTMRSVIKSSNIRYINCPGSDASNHIWNIDTESTTAVICEGIFDAESIESGGIAPGGKEVSDEQISQILQRKFEKIIIGGNNEEYRKGPQKMVELQKKLSKFHDNVSCFNWPMFCRKIKIPFNDFNQATIVKESKFKIADLEHFLIKDWVTTEVIYRTNTEYPR